MNQSWPEHVQEMQSTLLTTSASEPGKGVVAWLKCVLCSDNVLITHPLCSHCTCCLLYLCILCCQLLHVSYFNICEQSYMCEHPNVGPVPWQSVAQPAVLVLLDLNTFSVLFGLVWVPPQQDKLRKFLAFVFLWVCVWTFLDVSLHQDKIYTIDIWLKCTILQCTIIFHSVDDSPLELVDQVFLERRKTGQLLSTYQRKELYKSFLNNSKLTKDVRINLSNRLSLPQYSVVNFFKRENRKPRNESISAYLNLLQGE